MAMPNKGVFRKPRIVAAIFAVVCVAAGQFSFAQMPARSLSAFAANPVVGARGISPGPAIEQPLQSMQRGPLARLVENPQRSSGLPPFALADQSGTIQRYIEPVAGIDLAPYVNQVVIVRHDTGKTLLASQLELPALPLYPMLGEATANGSGRVAQAALGSGYARSGQGSHVQQAQYIDHDDSSVQLLDEVEQLPNGNGYPGTMSQGAVYPDGAYPQFPGQMPPGVSGMGAGACCDPMYCGPPGAESYTGQYGMAPCPQCGGYHPASGYAPEMGYVQPFGEQQRERPHCYAEVEINFLRLHIMEEQIGKLSEKYEFSPRFIVGFTGVGALDGRARYWLYGRETETLNDDAIRLEFDVLDLEATHHFAGRRSEVVLGGGLRLAHIELADDDDAEAGCDLIGLTVAADGRTPLLTLDQGRFGWVYGGRLSILGGDWGGEDDNDFVNGRVRDDNVVVHELYAGVEFGRRYRNLDLHARIAFEMQNWHSDVLAERADIESIGIVGPGLRLGAEF